LRSRQQMKKKVKALAAEPKTSAMILGALPFIMFAIIFMLNNDYVMTLFEDPRGKFVIGLGLFSEGLGVAIMVKMVNFEI
jgi:tight adherence protein B